MSHALTLQDVTKRYVGHLAVDRLSLAVPTATSVRSLPVTLLIDQRVVINNHLRRARGGKVSYTHLIGYALV